MVQSISHYANSQNTIQPADFSANHPYHVKIEELSSTVWCPDGQGRWFYERARGSYQVALAREGSTPAAARRFKIRTPPQRRFTKPEATKYLNAWDQKPHLVSLGAQKNFDHFMQGLMAGKSEDWTPDQTYYRQLIAKTILFRAAQKIVRARKFPQGKANISAYLVAYLSWRTSQAVDLEAVWQSQVVSPALIAIVGELVGRGRGAPEGDCARSAGERMVETRNMLAKVEGTPAGPARPSPSGVVGEACHGQRDRNRPRTSVQGATVSRGFPKHRGLQSRRWRDLAQGPCMGY
jgi:hypothetical protein